MTRKDFELLASAMLSSRPFMYITDGRALHPDDRMDFARSEQWREDVVSLAGDLARTNPRFDRERFLKACGL